MEAATLDAGRDDEIAFLGRIGNVGEHAFSLGGYGDAVIGEAVVRGGENQHDAGQVRRPETPLDEPHRQILKLAFPLGGDHRNARSGLNQTARLAKGDLPGADHQDRAVLQIEKDRIMPQPQM